MTFSDRDKEYNKDYDLGAAAIRRYGFDDISYISELESYIDLAKPKDVNMLFDKFTDNNLPVYIIGITNNNADFNEITREIYMQMRRERKTVMLGQWTVSRDIVYRDVALVISGISRDQALKYKRQYNQLSIVVIQKNDVPEFL